MASPMHGPRGYFSDIEYHFDEDQTDAIIRTTAYHRKDFCQSVIWFPPREHVGVRQSLTTPFPRTSTTGLGSFERLPIELLHDILSRLDMRSVLNFRQTNLGARLTLDSFDQYQMVVSHGLNLLCALLRTRLATSISLFDCYDALCTKACPLCGEYGGFVSLLNWTRCCFECLQRAPETQVRSLHSTRVSQKELGVPKAKIKQLRSFKTLPGIYSMAESVTNCRTTVVSAYQLVLMSERDSHAILARTREEAERGRREKLNFMGSCALPYYDRRSSRVEHGVSCAGCQLALEKDIIGSEGEDWPFEARNKVYSRNGFLDHFRWCQQAQVLWNSSGQGSNQPPELPEFARTGGFSNNDCE